MKGLHIGSFVIGTVVGFSISGYYILKSDTFHEAFVGVSKKKIESFVHFLLYSDEELEKKMEKYDVKYRKPYTSYAARTTHEKMSYHNMAE